MTTNPSNSMFDFDPVPHQKPEMMPMHAQQIDAQYTPSIEQSLSAQREMEELARRQWEEQSAYGPKWVSWLFKALNTASTPVKRIMKAMITGETEGLLSNLLSDLNAFSTTKNKDYVSFRDIMRLLGLDDKTGVADLPILGESDVLNFVGEILVDPLTWVGAFGAKEVAKPLVGKATRIMSEAVEGTARSSFKTVLGRTVKAGANLLPVERAARFVEHFGEEGARLLSKNADDALKAIANQFPDKADDILKNISSAASDNLFGVVKGSAGHLQDSALRTISELAGKIEANAAIKGPIFNAERVGEWLRQVAVNMPDDVKALRTAQQIKWATTGASDAARLQAAKLAAVYSKGLGGGSMRAMTEAGIGGFRVGLEGIGDVANILSAPASLIPGVSKYRNAAISAIRSKVVDVPLVNRLWGSLVDHSKFRYFGGAIRKAFSRFGGSKEFRDAFNNSEALGDMFDENSLHIIENINGGMKAIASKAGGLAQGAVADAHKLLDVSAPTIPGVSQYEAYAMHLGKVAREMGVSAGAADPESYAQTVLELVDHLKKGVDAAEHSQQQNWLRVAGAAPDEFAKLKSSIQNANPSYPARYVDKLAARELTKRYAGVIDTPFPTKRTYADMVNSVTEVADASNAPWDAMKNSMQYEDMIDEERQMQIASRYTKTLQEWMGKFIPKRKLDIPMPDGASQTIDVLSTPIDELKRLSEIAHGDTKDYLLDAISRFSGRQNTYSDPVINVINEHMKRLKMSDNRKVMQLLNLLDASALDISNEAVLDTISAAAAMIDGRSQQSFIHGVIDTLVGTNPDVILPAMKKVGWTLEDFKSGLRAFTDTVKQHRGEVDDLLESAAVAEVEAAAYRASTSNSIMQQQRIALPRIFTPQFIGLMQKYESGAEIMRHLNDSFFDWSRRPSLDKFGFPIGMSGTDDMVRGALKDAIQDAKPLAQIENRAIDDILNTMIERSDDGLGPAWSPDRIYRASDNFNAAFPNHPTLGKNAENAVRVVIPGSEEAIYVSGEIAGEFKRRLGRNFAIEAIAPAFPYLKEVREFSRGKDAERYLLKALSDVAESGRGVFEKNPVAAIAEWMSRGNQKIVRSSFGRSVMNLWGAAADIAPAGYRAINTGSEWVDAMYKGKMFNPQVASSLEAWYRSINPRNVSQFQRVYGNVLRKYINPINKLLRFVTTKIYPSYWERNFITEAWQSNLGGGLSIEGYNYAARGMLRRGKTFAAIRKYGNDFRRFLKGDKNPIVKMDSGEALPLNDLVEEAEAQGIFGAGEFFGGYLAPQSRMASMMDDQIGVVLPNISSPGRFKTINNGLQFAEDITRFAHYITRRMRGDNAADAASSVFTFLFNFKDIGATTRALEPALWFARWTRKSLGFNFWLAMHHPQVFTTLAKVVRESQKPGSDKVVLTNDMVPQWMNGLGIRIADDGNFLVDGKLAGPEFIGTEFVIPQMEFLSIASGFGLDLLNRTSPLIRLPVELAMNTNMFTKRQIRKYEEEGDSFISNPEFRHIARSIRPINSIMRAIEYGPGGELVKALAPVRAQSAQVKWSAKMSILDLSRKKSELKKRIDLAEKEDDQEKLNRLDDELYNIEERMEYMRYIVKTVEQNEADSLGSIDEPTGIR